MTSQQAGPTVPDMPDLFEKYPFGRAWDEMFEAAGSTRPAYATVHQALQKLDAADLKSRAEILGRSFLDQGITFALGGVERPFPLDLIPRIITASEWQAVEQGVSQRVRALEKFLADAYGPGRSSPTGWCRGVWSPPARTSSDRSPASERRTVPAWCCPAST